MEEDDARIIAKGLIAEGKQIAEEDVGRNKEMSKHGAEWLLHQYENSGSDDLRLNVLTVCNTGSLATSVSHRGSLSLSLYLHRYLTQGYGTALGLITHLHELGKLNKAYYTQTAPYHQGSR